MVTISNWIRKETFSYYTNIKHKYLFLKSRRHSRKQGTLFVFQKVLLFLLVVLTFDAKLPSRTQNDLNTAIVKDNELFTIQYITTLLTKFKKSRSHSDNENYKKSRNKVQRMIKDKKKNFVIGKLNDNIGKPKELWKSLKSLGLPSKANSAATICLEKDGILSFDPKTNAEIFKDFYSNLEYNIQVLTIEMTGRKPLCIRVQITAVMSAFYFMPVLCVLYSKTLKR